MKLQTVLSLKWRQIEYCGDRGWVGDSVKAPFKVVRETGDRPDPLYLSGFASATTSLRVPFGFEIHNHDSCARRRCDLAKEFRVGGGRV